MCRISSALFALLFLSSAAFGFPRYVGSGIHTPSSAHVPSRGFAPPTPLIPATVMRQSALPLGFPRGTNILGNRVGLNGGGLGLYGGGLGLYGGFRGFGGGFGYGDYFGGSGNEISVLDYDNFSFPFYTPTGSPSSLSLPPLPNDHPSTARLMLDVPLGADVWLSGKKIDMGGGTTRTFESPQLKADEVYTVDVRVTWNEAGKSVEEKRTMTMKPGDYKSLQYFASRLAANVVSPKR
jgi:uncharacterized protein (TIGR03000 family)